MPLFVDFNMCSDLWGFVGLCFCSAGIDVVLSIWLSAQHDLQSIHFHKLATIASHPDSVDDHNTETWTHIEAKHPNPRPLYLSCSHCVFRLFLASPSITLLWHTPKHGYEKTGSECNGSMFPLDKMLRSEDSSHSHCCLTFAWNAKNNTV